MKQLLIIIAAVVLLGCGESQLSTPAPEVNPVELIAEAANLEAPSISIHDAVLKSKFGSEVVKEIYFQILEDELQNQLPKEIYEKAEDYALKLFKRGEDWADKQVLILVDT